MRTAIYTEDCNGASWAVEACHVNNAYLGIVLKAGKYKEQNYFEWAIMVLYFHKQLRKSTGPLDGKTS